MLLKARFPKLWSANHRGYVMINFNQIVLWLFWLSVEDCYPLHSHKIDKNFIALCHYLHAWDRVSAVPNTEDKIEVQTYRGLWLTSVSVRKISELWKIAVRCIPNLPHWCHICTIKHYLMSFILHFVQSIRTGWAENLMRHTIEVRERSRFTNGVSVVHKVCETLISKAQFPKANHKLYHKIS